MKSRMSYFTKRDLFSLEVAVTVDEVMQITRSVLDRTPKPREWVVGALTSGLRAPEENRKRLHKTIVCFKERRQERKKAGATINHLPFQRCVMNILRRRINKKNLSPAEEFLLQEQLRDEFYIPLFKEGYVDQLCILPGSDASLNIHWMREYCLTHGIPVRFIPVEIIKDLEQE